MNKIALINKSAPYGTSNGQEGLDMALAMSNFAQDVSLFFIEDGVFQLLNNQQAATINAKAYHKTFAALEFYDIENIYVCQQSLLQRNIQPSDLCIQVSLTQPQDMAELIAAQRHVMVF